MEMTYPVISSFRPSSEVIEREIIQLFLDALPSGALLNRSGMNSRLPETIGETSFYRLIVFTGTSLIEELSQSGESHE
jgi:hypothetical protein